MCELWRPPVCRKLPPNSAMGPGCAENRIKSKVPLLRRTLFKGCELFGAPKRATYRIQGQSGATIEQVLPMPIYDRAA